MKRLFVGALILVAAVAAGWWWRGHRTTAAPGGRTGSDAAVGPGAIEVPGAAAASAGAGPAAPVTAGKVKRVAPEERNALVKRIQEAQARRTAARSASATAAGAASGAEDDPMHTASGVLKELQAVIGEVSDHVESCQKEHAPTLKGFNADLMLRGDPDIGTLIDASALVGLDGETVPAAFDDCVRARMQELELPPMHTGDAFKVNLGFSLTDDEEDDADAR